MENKKLPVGIENFEEIRREGLTRRFFDGLEIAGGKNSPPGTDI